MRLFVRVIFSVNGFGDAIIRAVNAYNNDNYTTPILLIEATAGLFGASLYNTLCSACQDGKKESMPTTRLNFHLQYADPVNPTDYDIMPKETRKKKTTVQLLVHSMNLSNQLNEMGTAE